MFKKFSVLLSIILLLLISSLFAEETLTSINLILLLDQSGSMSGTETVRATDPKGLRIIASKYIADYLTLDATEKSWHRLAVVNFGYEVPEDKVIDFVVLKNSENAETVKDNLSVLNLGGTDFIPAFETAYELLGGKDEFPEDRKNVIILFTDGEPEPRGGYTSKSSYFSKLQDRCNSLKENGAEVFVVALDEGGVFWEKDRHHWEEVAPNRCFLARDASDITKIFHDIIISLIGAGSEESLTLKPGDNKITVKPYLERVTFTVFKDPSQDITIKDSKGNSISSNSEGVGWSESAHQLIITQEDPHFGKWNINLSGGPSLKMWVDFVPYEPELVEPRENQPQGKPFNIIFSLTKRDGRPVGEIGSQPITLSAYFMDSNGAKIKVKLKKPKDGKYVSVNKYTDKEFPLGEHRIISQMQIETKNPKEKNHIFTVKALPYLIVEYPEEGEFIPQSEDTIVRLRLMYKGEPTDAESLFINAPEAIIFGKMTDEGKSDKLEKFLPIDGETGLFEAEFPEITEEGEHHIEIIFEGDLIDGERFEADKMKLTITRKKTTLHFIIYWTIITLIVLLGLRIVCGGIMWFIRPTMRGRLVITKNGFQRSLRLRGFLRRKKTYGKWSFLRFLLFIFGLNTSWGREVVVTGKRYKDEYGDKTIQIRVTYYGDGMNRRTLRDGDCTEIGPYEFCFEI